MLVNSYPHRHAGGVGFLYNAKVAPAPDGLAPRHQPNNQIGPQRRMALDAATIALIRIDYEESDLTVVAIGLKYGRSPSYICRLAREGGWLMRSERLGRRPRSGPSISLHEREAIARRLSRVINKKLDQMENDMESGKLSPEEAERGAKTVASMIGGYDKVLVRAEDPDEERKRACPAADPGTVDEVERLQREIIERFERIQRRREAEGRSQ